MRKWPFLSFFLFAFFIFVFTVHRTGIRFHVCAMVKWIVHPSWGIVINPLLDIYIYAYYVWIPIVGWMKPYTMI